MREGFRVQDKQCATCIYRPDSPLNIKELERQIADPHMPGHFKKHRQCHHSRKSFPVCCRGFWNRHKDHFDAGQLAQRLNGVVFVHVDTLKKEKKMNRRTINRVVNEIRRKSAKPKFKTLEKYVRLICDGSCAMVSDDKKPQERFLSKRQYDDQIKDANHGWRCPSCHEYPCRFDDRYFELPLAEVK